MKIIKEYKKPTTIVITGQWVEGIGKSLMITDDESGIDVRRFDGDTFSLTTYGHIYVLTEEQFNWFITSDHYALYCDDDDIENLYIPIKDFIGVIGATGITDDGVESDEWDINDYFYHQIDDGVFYPILDIKGEYNIQPMNIKEVKEFLASNKDSIFIPIPEIKSPLEVKIEALENRIESQAKQIALLSDAIDWCERNIKL